MVSREGRFTGRPVPVPFPGAVPLSLYIHWPWCARKCPYCDFNSRAVPGEIPESRYIAALLAQLEAELPLALGRPLQTIYIGGGTPSLMTPEGMRRLLDGVRARLALVPDCEISMEANPGTLEAGRFEAYAACGVNRASIGVQSFSGMELRHLGRIHSPQEAKAAAREAARVFGNFNLDLMFGLPDEDGAGLAADMREALAAGSTHLSFYQLTLEEGTAFAKRPPAGMPDPDQLWEMTEAIIKGLSASGFRRYEVSGYAKPGFECRHNLNYWRYGDYLAIGAGAHGKASSERGILRFAASASPLRFMREIEAEGGSGETRWVTDEELPFEFMLNGLRLLEGVPEDFFLERTGLSVGIIAPELESARNAGLLSEEAGVFRATEKGMDFLSDLQEIFLV